MAHAPHLSPTQALRTAYASVFVGLCGAISSVGCPAPPQPTEYGEPFTLTFAAQVGGAPFACGETYANIGVAGSTFEPGDLRLYISNVHLHGADADVFATIDVEAPWQANGTALLDFEDGSGRCVPGTTETNAVVQLHAPAGEYTGVSFVVGVPEDFNHADLTRAPAPLNVSSMFWGWTAGYRFFKLDLFSTGAPTGWLVHVGSAGCQVDAGGAVTACQHSNRAEVTLDGWNTERTIAIDVAALLAGSDINANTDATAPGCMSEPEDPDCAPLFARLGLPFGDTGAGVQSAFALVDAP